MKQKKDCIRQNIDKKIKREKVNKSFFGHPLMDKTKEKKQHKKKTP